MQRSKFVLGSSLLALLAGSVLLAAKPSGDSAGDKTETHRGHARLTKPYSELKDLTDDEKTKIVEIHQKAVDQIHEIEAKEKQDILAVLSPAQKKELADIEAKDKEDARERRHHATTQPSGESATSSKNTK